MVSYMKDFGEQAYFLNFPSKFISPDGQTLWLCYSANFSPGWNGVKLELQSAGRALWLVSARSQTTRSALIED